MTDVFFEVDTDGPAEMTLETGDVDSRLEDRVAEQIDAIGVGSNLQSVDVCLAGR